jgi:hypothetical protein
VDHRQQVGTMGDQRGGVVEGDAADHGDRQFHLGAGLLQQIDAGSRRAGLGDRIEEAAEGDIAGAFLGGLFGQFEAGVAGRTDDGLEPSRARAGVSGPSVWPRCTPTPRRAASSASSLMINWVL